MIIELYGLPGSGKSTLAWKLAEERNWILVACKGKREVLYYFFLGFVHKPKVFLLGFLLALQYNRSLYAFWNFYCVRYAKYQKAHKYKAENVILDEGPLQNALSLPHTKLTVNQAQLYVNNLLLADVVIVFNLNSDKRKRQLLERSFQSRKRTEEVPLRESIMIENDRTIQTMLQENVSCYFVVDGTERTEVIQFLERTLSNV